MTAAHQDDDWLEDTVAVYLERMRVEGKLDIEPSAQCKVCRDPLVRGLVNAMLARAYTPTDIHRTLEAHNRSVPKRRQIGYDSVYRHARDHFSIQEPANAIWRNMVQRQYERDGNDVATGVGTMVGHLSFLHTALARSYETLVDPTTQVSVEQGIKIASKIAEIERKDDDVLERAQMLSRMNSVIEMVRKFVPKERWPELQAALRGETATVDAVVSSVAAPPVRMVEISDIADEEEER